MKGKVLWVGDAGAATGFARCTEAACDELYRSGWDVQVLGINYRGDPHKYPYLVYPCLQPFDDGMDAMGVSRLPVLASRFLPHVIVLLNDPWNVAGHDAAYLEYYRRFTASMREKARESGPKGIEAIEKANKMDATHFVGWLAVDAENQKGEPLNALDSISVWTQFAAEELKRGGYSGDPRVIPLGVDHHLFRPVEREVARNSMLPANVPRDAFVIGALGRNQPRKRLDLTIRYFKQFIDKFQADDAYLYLHVAPTGDREFDLRALAKYYEIPPGRVLVARPSVGYGDPEESLPMVYSALDLFITTTQGEGWGLPVLEAMACGTPCQVPDWSALGDWPGEAVTKIPCTSTALNSPLNGNAYTVGGIADEHAFVAAMGRMYRHPEARAELAASGLAKAKEFSWQRTGRMFREFLEGTIEGREREAA